MPLPLSNDLRWRIVWLHYYKELDLKTIADMLYIHTSTARRIISRYDAHGDISPVAYSHGPLKKLGDPEELCIVESLLANPAMYLSELQEELFQTTGLKVSISTIFRTVRRLGFTRKKLRNVALQQSEVRRNEFMEEMSYLDAKMIVWLDETGTDKRKERRLYGYNLRGITPTSYKLTVYGKRLSSIAIMSTRGIEDFDTYEGNINGDIFCSFIERCLTPILQPFNGSNERSVVVMDNASIHHVDKVAKAIQSTGAIIRFLPPYSPDYNPIEESFAKLKAFTKSNEVAFNATTSPHLLVAMGFNTITIEDCLGYIRHAGYQVSL